MRISDWSSDVCSSDLLSQHPGGFVLTQERLDDLVPIEPARMDDRQIIEWDKDDIDALKFMKVDVLGHGMLGCMNRAFNLQIGRASCRERVCQYVEISVYVVFLK